MMTYLRYWSPVGFGLLGLAIATGLTTFSSKWSHVVVGFMLLPIAWSFHYLRKRSLRPKDPDFWVIVFIILAIISTVLAGNFYAALLGSMVMVVGIVIFQLVRSFTAEHQTPFNIGVLAIGIIGIGLTLLVTKTSINVPWVSTIGKNPLALGALSIVPLICGMLLIKRQPAWKNLVLGIACVAVAIPLVMPSTYRTVQEAWQNTARFSPALESIVRAHPLFGVGAENAKYVYPSHAKTTSLFLTESPSTAWDVLLSFGLVSAFVLIGLLVTTVASLWTRPGWWRKFVLSFGLLVFLGLCVVGNLWKYPGLFLMFWVLLGLSAAPTEAQEYPDKATRQHHRKLWLTLGFLFACQSIVMGIGLNRFARAERTAQSGDTKTAAGLYATSLRFDPDPDQRRAYAESLWLNGYSEMSFTEAEHQAKIAYDWNRHDAFARQVAARVAFSQGKYSDAERLYHETLERDPYFSLDAYLSLADVYKKQGKKAEEQQILEQGLLKYPKDATINDVVNAAFLEQLQQIRRRLGE